MSTKEKHPLQDTFGGQLVGINLNPAADPNVTRAKELCAELANLLNDTYQNAWDPGDEDVAPGFEDPLLETLLQHAIGEILNAQMCAVKVLTFNKK